MPKIKLHQRTREFALPRGRNRKRSMTRAGGLMLGVSQSHFEVAGGRLVVKDYVLLASVAEMQHGKHFGWFSLLEY
jgi:hypothetical protein